MSDGVRKRSCEGRGESRCRPCSPDGKMKRTSVHAASDPPCGKAGPRRLLSPPRRGVWENYCFKASEIDFCRRNSDSECFLQDREARKTNMDSRDRQTASHRDEWQQGPLSPGERDTARVTASGLHPGQHPCPTRRSTGWARGPLPRAFLECSTCPCLCNCPSRIRALLQKPPAPPRQAPVPLATRRQLSWPCPRARLCSPGPGHPRGRRACG